ncbi:autophagy protein [Actinomortierella wolfii]|nr:autophagy protein [Actinomortierella wolfii]
MKLLHTIDTSPNPGAVCALAPSSENCYLAYPSPTPSPSSPFSANGRDAPNRPSGDVLLFDALSLQVVNIVQAHKTSVSNISINHDGTMIATASDKANTDTVHIFKLGGSNSGPNGVRRVGSAHLESSLEKKGGGGVSGMIRRQSMHIGKNLAGSVGSYLPSMVTEMFEPSRDFAYLKLPSGGVQSVVALSNTTPQVMVATSDGYLYQYNIDLENGGPCVLLKQYSLLDSTEEFGLSAGSD